MESTRHRIDVVEFLVRRFARDERRTHFNRIRPNGTVGIRCMNRHALQTIPRTYEDRRINEYASGRIELHVRIAENAAAHSSRKRGRTIGSYGHLQPRVSTIERSRKTRQGHRHERKSARIIKARNQHARVGIRRNRPFGLRRNGRKSVDRSIRAANDIRIAATVRNAHRSIVAHLGPLCGQSSRRRHFEQVLIPNRAHRLLLRIRKRLRGRPHIDGLERFSIVGTCGKSSDRRQCQTTPT